MIFVKENIMPTIIILVASFLVIFASLPLANTEWAEGFRNGGEGGEGQFEEGEGGEERGPPEGVPAVAMIILPLVKVTILMGIGALFTALGLWIARLVSGKKKKVPQESG